MVLYTGGLEPMAIGRGTGLKVTDNVVVGAELVTTEGILFGEVSSTGGGD